MSSSLSASPLLFSVYHDGLSIETQHQMLSSRERIILGHCFLSILAGKLQSSREEARNDWSSGETPGVKAGIKDAAVERLLGLNDDDDDSMNVSLSRDDQSQSDPG